MSNLAPPMLAWSKTVRVAYRTGSAIVRRARSHLPTPLSTTIALTNRCTALCSYCSIPQAGHAAEQPVEWWLNFLGEVRRAGGCRIQVTGGEPLLYDGVETVVARARELGLIVSIGTNGVLLPERRSILQHLDYLVISVDGPAELTDRQRFVGSHDAAIEAVRLAREAGVTSWITSVITAATIDHLPEIIAWAELHDIRLPFHPPDYCGQDNTDIFPSSDQIRRMLDVVRPHSGSRGRILNSLAYWRHVEEWAHLGPHIGTSGGPNAHECDGGKLIYHVEPDGRLFACTHRVGCVRGASIPELGLTEAIAAVNNPDCSTCLSGYAHEQSLLFALRPSAISSWTEAIGSFLFRPHELDR